ncbi:MAG: 50S ribosome-binding GTPase [Bacilli bacterium]|nr:50S ribosome-binding GTPase [Bacilli bacterium]
MNRCVGCGAILQDEEPLKEGYVKNINSRLCERCFKIQNYGDYIPAIKDESEFIQLLKDINNTRDLVVLVCDLFNFNPNMELINKYITNDVILVLTKRDLLPKSLYEEKLLNYIDDVNLHIVDRIIISSNNNYHFDELIETIKNHKKSNDVYVIGYTNVGKSTMINKILYNYADSNDVITTSLLPNTTIDNISIKIDDDLTLIDTPGVLDSGSIYYQKDIKELKRIIPKKEIKPISYQINKKQSIVVEDLFRIDLEKNDIVLYMSNRLDIKRFYKNINTNNMDKYEIDISANYDIVLSGLGFIKFMKDEHITLYVIKGLDVKIRKSLI